MADKLVEIFHVVEKKAGLNGRIQFAQKTGTSLDNAERMEDDPEILARFKKVASEIIGQPVEAFLTK